MSGFEQAERQLPFLRRYARAVTGNPVIADRLAESAFATVLKRNAEHIRRVDLYAELDARLSMGADQTGPGGPRLIATDARRAFLLTAMEGFAAEEAAAIMRKEKSDFDALVRSSESEMRRVRATSVLIIEDETLIAAHLAQLVRDMGHEVFATVSTKQDAIQACRHRAPGLLLADIRLADGSSGAEAVAEITAHRNIPVIFITAYPQALLQGARGEPAYLIQKPFQAATVRAIIHQALVQPGTGTDG